MNKNLKISVCMITYGHEKYILQAIEGVLMQQCDFEVELILANDCSPDSTDQVIQDILTNHPRSSWIKYFKHEQNLGMIPNFIDALKKCEGKYVALCDGDDYWTDPLKLQKQVDFLEANEDYVIHSGKAKVLEDEEFKQIIGNPLLKNDYQVSDFLTKNNLITCTIMFRNIDIDNVYFEKVFFADWLLYVTLLSKNKNYLAFVSEEVFAVYRMHQQGGMQTLKDKNDSDIAHVNHIIILKKYINSDFTTADLKQINNYCLRIFKHFYNNKNYKKCVQIIFNNICLVNINLPIRKYLSFIKHN